MRRVSLSPQFRSLSCPYFVKRASAPHFNVPFVRARRFTPCYIVGFATTNHALYFSWPQQTKVCPPAALAASLLACLLPACCRCMLSRLVSCSTCVLLRVAHNPLSYELLAGLLYLQQRLRLRSSTPPPRQPAETIETEVTENAGPLLSSPAAAYTCVYLGKRAIWPHSLRRPTLCMPSFL